LDNPRNHERLLLGLMVMLFGYLVLPPLFFMGWSSISPGSALAQAGGISLRAYEAIFTSPSLPRLVWDTLVFGLGSTVVGACLGGVMAWIVERTNVPGRQGAYVAVFLGFAVPAMIRVIGWILLLGSRNGALNLLSQQLFGPHGPMANVETMPGMIFVEGSFWAPVAFLLMVGPFRGMDASLEEAAEMAGASPWRTYRSVTLKVIFPSILSILILTFIRTVQAFEVPLFLGVPAGIHVLTASIYTDIQESYVPDYAQASAYGILLLAFLSLVLWLYASVTRHASRFHTITGKAFRSRRIDLGPWRWAAAAFIWLMVVIEGLPGAYMMLASFLRSFGTGRVSLWQNFTDANYRQLSAFPGIAFSMLNSLIIALVSASVAVVLAVIASWLLARAQVGGRRTVDFLIGLPLVFPGVVMSLAMLIMYLRVPLHIYGTIWVFVLAYVATFTPYAIRYTHPALLQIHRELEEVASVSGAGWVRTFCRILAPLLKPAMLGAWMFIFLISLRELAVASLLYTAHSQVIATQMLDMWTNGNLNVLSAFGTLVSILGAVVAGVVFRLTRSIGA
jgi:iron(III) transport system permease protein